MASQSERQFWEAIALITLDGILAIVGLLGANFPVTIVTVSGF
jgi:hypothetical protein